MTPRALVVWAGLLLLPREAAASCAAPANAIEAENCLPGNPSSEWDVSGSGDPSLQGFATDIGVNRGGTIHFKIKTDASSYAVNIYRLGWYGGAGARKIASLAPSAVLPQAQPDCLNDGSTGLIDCGDWAESASWTVPSTAASGLYVARLVRSDTGGASHVLFVVRDDGGRSALLMQVSDTSWQAYNRYGGNSLYVSTAADRAYKVSYNRPFTTRDYSSSYPFTHEIPMIRFLESNGYDVSYFTGVDADRGGTLIANHKVYMTVGHDEYWSAAQRTNVEAAGDAGVHLVFLAANDVFWKTRWEPSIDGSSTPYRTLVCYKETYDGKIDPAPFWTGTWRDARFSPPYDGGRPENRLTGTLYTVDAFRDDTLTVPDYLGRMRLWRNTPVASMAAGQSVSFPELLGYEWNEDADNGARPPGLVRLSSTTLFVDQRLINEGYTYAASSATHALTLYRRASGALVFSAGTMQWPWGLDASHDHGSGTPASPALQQATVNLLADMGLQPASLRPGLVAAAASQDATPPRSTITYPPGGAPLPQGPTTITGAASDAGGGVVAGVEISVDGGATWHPAAGRESWSYAWNPPASGSITIRSRAVDDSGNLESPSSGVTVGSTRTASPPPAGPVIFQDSFNLPDGLITNEYAYYNPGAAGAVASSTWDVPGGSLFSQGGQGWTGVPDNVTPNAGSTNGNDSAAFRALTKRGDFGNVAVQLTLTNLGMIATSSTPAAATDGVHLYARYQGPNQLYLASLNRRDNTVALKKRVPSGTSGTYYDLGHESYMVPYSTPQALKLAVQNNPDGSVALSVTANGAVLLSTSDAGVGGAPIAAPGKLGLRGDNDNFKISGFTVVSLDSATAGGSASTTTASPPPAPPPVLAAISPSSAAAGGPGFTLIASGTGFTPASVVRLNGTSRTTTFVSTASLAAAITAGDLVLTGTAAVAVFDSAGGLSSSQTLTIVSSAAPAVLNVYFQDSFNRPDGLITNEFAFNNPASTSASRSPAWDVTDGSLFTQSGQGWTGVPDNAAPNAGSTNGTGSAAFKLLSKRSDFGDAAVLFSLTNLGLVATSSTPATATDGVHVWARYQGPNQFYIVSVNRRDGTAAIKKQVPIRKGGTSYDLAHAAYAVPFKSTQTVKVTVQNNPSGSVALALYANGVRVVSAIDAGKGGAPITAPGKLGLRGDNDNFKLAAFVVAPATASPSLASISPNSAAVGAPGFALSVSGSGFSAASVVLWNGATRATTFVSSAALSATIPASDLASPGQTSVGVYEPSSGLVSNAKTFSAAAPLVPASAPFSKLAADLDHVRAFPNPWRADRHQGLGVTFDNLTEGSTIKLFTVSGRWIRSLSATGGTAGWNLANDAGQPAASGYYIYLITDGAGRKAKGVLQLIR